MVVSSIVMVVATALLRLNKKCFSALWPVHTTVMYTFMNNLGNRLSLYYWLITTQQSHHGVIVNVKRQNCILEWNFLITVKNSIETTVDTLFIYWFSMPKLPYIIHSYPQYVFNFRKQINNVTKSIIMSTKINKNNTVVIKYKCARWLNRKRQVQ